MLKSGKWILAITVALAAVSQQEARACTLENCTPGMPSACYNPNGVKWCQVTYGGGPYGHYTPINSYNHSSYGTAVTGSWTNWNSPPNGPTNSVYLYTDNINNSSHDIDYWNTSSTDWWWGLADYPGGIGGGGCINRGGARIQFNTTRVSTNATWQLWLAEHETGHAIGLDHVCGCAQGRVMNPCTECSAPATLSYCDGQGANSLYH